MLLGDRACCCEAEHVAGRQSLLLGGRACCWEAELVAGGRATADQTQNC